MTTELYWIPTPRKQGRLAIAPRPRGGDWLADELAAWKRLGVNRVVSLLTPEEMDDLDLNAEAKECGAEGMTFVSLPIPDREVPEDRTLFFQVADLLAERVDAGESVVLHCRQGIGRAGMLAVVTLMALGHSLDSAIHIVSRSRGRSVPETAIQLQWLQEAAPHDSPLTAVSSSERDRRLADIAAKPDNTSNWETIRTDGLQRYEQ